MQCWEDFCSNFDLHLRHKLSGLCISNMFSHHLWTPNLLNNLHLTIQATESNGSNLQEKKKLPFDNMMFRCHVLLEEGRWTRGVLEKFLQGDNCRRLFLHYGKKSDISRLCFSSYSSPETSAQTEKTIKMKIKLNL